jgi:hypothetical protein
MLLLASLLALTGCPGSGDRLRPDETTSVRRTANNEVCFAVHNAQDYQPVFISINPRAIPPSKQNISCPPQVKDAQLCIPSSFYTFASDGQFIVKYILNREPKACQHAASWSGWKFQKGKYMPSP